MSSSKRDKPPALDYTEIEDLARRADALVPVSVDRATNAVEEAWIYPAAVGPELPPGRWLCLPCRRPCS